MPALPVHCRARPTTPPLHGHQAGHASHLYQEETAHRQPAMFAVCVSFVHCIQVSVPIPSPCCQVDEVLKPETRFEVFKKHVRNGWGRHWQMQEKRVKNRSIDSGNKQAVLMSSSTFGIPRSNVTATSTVSRFAAYGRSGGIGLLNPTKCRLEWPSIHGCQEPRSRYHRRRLTLWLLEQLNQHVGNVRSWS